MIISKVLELIEKNKTKEFNCIPYDGIFPRLSEYIHGLKKGLYYGVTGTPGSAKTQFTDHAFLYYPYDFCKSSNIDLEIVYFSFELSKEAKILSGISKKLFEEYGIKMSPNALQSIGKYKISDEVYQKVKDLTNYFSELEKYVTFYDEPLTPSQIYKIIEKKLLENGVNHYKKEEITENGIKKFVNVFDKYVPNNPEKYIVFIFDHISLIQQDTNQTKHEALTTFSNNNVFFRNRYNCTIVNVHQQSMEGSVKQFTSKGENVISKLEPQLALLADNKTLGRDYDIILGLFSPFRYEIDFYRGYHTKHFGDNCRFLSILKNRGGTPDLHVGLYFDGGVNYFEELPKSQEFKISKNGMFVDNTYLYEKYAKGLVGRLNPDIQKKITFL